MDVGEQMTIEENVSFGLAVQQDPFRANMLA
jgi:hypothetical protein